MGTNTSKPLTYATSTHGSARMGGVHHPNSYPNGPARMGGVHPKRRKVKKNMQNGHQRQTSEMDPEATLVGDSTRPLAQQHILQLSEAETIVNHSSGPPPPPYSR